MKNVTPKSGMNILKHKFVIGAGVLMLASAPFACSGQDSVGINFAGRKYSGGGATPMTLLSSDTAGVVGQLNWNNVFLDGANSGGLAQLNLGGANPGVVIDNSGATTGFSFSYTENTSASEWSVDNTVHTGNQQLLNGYWDIFNGNYGAVNIGNISYGLYDIYVYVSSDANNRTAGVNLNGGSQTYLLTDASGYNYSGALLQGTATTQGAAASAQYVLFQNVTGSSFEVDLHNYGSNMGLAGIQIVSVPEPSVLAISAGGFVLLALIRRRR